MWNNCLNYELRNAVSVKVDKKICNRKECKRAVPAKSINIFCVLNCDNYKQMLKMAIFYNLYVKNVTFRISLRNVQRNLTSVE
ncbi:hypothetical protein SDC9_162298 [bioreactor metagenome]|uniref:Uncharacterized protein n=1 Tax=bioreactor metagenome TaxID=1076179 RepID=A0A645FNP6_9ZZZZ